MKKLSFPDSFAATFLFVGAQVFFCISLVAQQSSQLTSTGWETQQQGYTSTRSSDQETIPVEFVIKLKGKVVEGQDRITLEGESKVENSRLKMYFKKLQRENDQSQYSSSGNSTGGYGSLSRSGSASSSVSGDDSVDGSMSWGSGSAAGIVSAHFKLLSLQPYTSTGKVTAEVYMGENDFSPYVEAVDVKLNPFKKTPLELLMTSFTEVDLRKVRVVVHLDGPVKVEWNEQEFTADFRCYLKVGEGYSNFGYQGEGMDDAEIQWVEDSE